MYKLFSLHYELTHDKEGCCTASAIPFVLCMPWSRTLHRHIPAPSASRSQGSTCLESSAIEAHQPLPLCCPPEILGFWAFDELLPVSGDYPPPSQQVHIFAYN